MTFMICIGSIVVLVGIAGVLWCISTIRTAQKSDLSEKEIRLVLARVLPKNLVALFVSMIGLMIVVVALLLG